MDSSEKSGIYFICSLDMVHNRPTTGNYFGAETSNKLGARDEHHYYYSERHSPRVADVLPSLRPPTGRIWRRASAGSDEETTGAQCRAAVMPIKTPH